MQDAGKIFNGIEKAGKVAFKAIAVAATASATAIGGVVASAVSVGSQFDAQMSTVQSIAQTTSSELASLREKAKEMGATTKFSATEAAQAMEYMGMAGWKAGQMTSGIEGIMYLAAASGEDLATTSDIVTDALTAFGMQAEESGRFADILAAASSNSNTNVSMMGETFKYAASLCGSLGYSAEDTAFAIGLMANSGIKSSQAGTTLRSAITNLVNPTDKMKAAMDRYGISATDADGKMLTLKQTLDLMREKMKVLDEDEQLRMMNNLVGDTSALAADAMAGLSEEEIFYQTALANGLEMVKDYSEQQLNSALTGRFTKKELKEMTLETKRNNVALEQGANALEGMSEAEQAAASARIFGKQALSGMLAILNVSQEEYEKLYLAIENCDGAAEKMSKIRQDNLIGDVTTLQSVYSGLQLQISEGVNEPLRNAVQWVTNFVRSISRKITNTNGIEKIAKSFTKFLPTAKRNLKEFSEAFLKFANPFIEAGKWMVQHPDVIVSTIVGIGSAIVAYKVAEGVMSLYNSFTSLAGVLTNPFALAILAVGAAIGGAMGVATYVSNANKKMKEQNLAEHFGKISLSLEDLQKVASHIVSTDKLGELQKAMTAFEDMGAIRNSLESTVSELNKMNWEVSIGMKLDDSQLNSYGESISNFINQSQELLLQKEYAVNLSLNVLTKDDATGNGIKEKFSSFYSAYREELTRLGEELGQAYSDAMKDKMLEPFEVENITKIQNQMNEITNKIASSQFEAKLETIGMKYEGGQLDAESFMNLQAEIQAQLDAAIAQLDETLEMNITNAKLMLDDDKIDLDQAEYEAMIKEFKANYLEQVGEIELKANKFQFDTILSQYGPELEEAMQEIQKITNDAIGTTFDNISSSTFDNINFSESQNAMFYWDEATIKKLIDYDGLSKGTKAALGDLFSLMEPSMESLKILRERCQQYGAEIPEGVSEGINDTALLGVLVDSSKGLWTAIEGSINNSEEYKSCIKKMRDNGTYVPQNIIDGIIEKKPELTKEVQALNRQLKKDLNDNFNKVFSVDARVKVNLAYETSNKNSVKIPNLDTSLGGHATGGIFDTPHIAWFAEAGPEAAIPIDGSKNAFDLWKKTGQLLGVMPDDSGKLVKANSLFLDDTGNKKIQEGDTFYTDKTTSSSDFTYNPVFNFYGEKPDEKDLEKVTKSSYVEFEKYMKQYEKNKARLCF